MSVKPSALSQLYLDLFTTAIEGGINYWAVTDSYHHSNGGVEDHAGFKAVIFENYGEMDQQRHVIDRSVIAKGFNAARQPKWRNGIRWSSDKPPTVVGPQTDWDYDAGDADVIVQLGLFGEVVYG